MLRRTLLAIVFCLGSFNAACPPTSCTLNVVTGVYVHLTDAVTNEPINDATLTFTNGDFQQQADPSFGKNGEMQYGYPGVYAGAHERAGKYTLTITAPGYKPQVLQNIEVIQRDLCHVETTYLEIQLQPAS